MLFSGGSTGQKGTPPKESKKERKPDKDEKYEIQEAVFLHWINSVIDDSLQDLKELADVRHLQKFATLILGVPVALSGKNDADDIDAIFHAMMPDDPDDKLFQISVNELLSGQQKPLLTMCWQLIQIYWAKFAPSPSNERKMTEALKEWCLEATSTHPDTQITDFTSSFRDGMAINILIKSFDDQLVDLQEICELRGEDRIENALSLARRHFNVPKLVQPKDFYSEHLDMKSVACYLMMLYLGMCESSNRSKMPARRRSTAPANVGNLTQPSGTARKQSQPEVATQKVTGRQSISGQAVSSQATNPPKSVPKIRTDSVTSVPSTPPIPTSTTAAPPRIVQANMLSPPPVPQSPKAYTPLFQSGSAASQIGVISPLAQQSHTQAQLIQQHQQQQLQVEAQQQAQQAALAAQAAQAAAQVQAAQQAQLQQMQQLQSPQTGPQFTQAQPAQIIVQQQQPQPAQLVPMPTVQSPSQQLPPLPQLVIQQQPAVQIVPQRQSSVQFVQAIQPQQQQQPQHPQQLLISQGLAAQLQAAQLPPVSIPPIQQQPTGQQQMPATSAEQYHQQLSPKSLAQFTLPQPSNEGEGMRSRKSSSSSHSRGRRRKPEEMLQEYDSYLQQVLTWLTEAEQELESMGEVQEGDVDIGSLEAAKEKFREHEQYMQSLTQSQDNVGRVLHRGHQLSQRLEGEASTTIISQLQVVSSRWEKIRKKAMARQTALQNQIDRIQRKHLSELGTWFDKIELRTKEMDPLADNIKDCEKQLEELSELQRLVKKKQPAIEQLSSFVAVVDQSIAQQQREGIESGAESHLEQLETLVKQMDKRWAKLGEQLEQRGKLLDGIADLLEQYEQSTGQLSKWLSKQMDELQKLLPPRELSTGEEVQQQLDLLRAMERALALQQESFVRLSRICTDLAGKFEKGKNLRASEKVHEKLDAITQTWDQIVTRLEEHSELLIQSGKVKLATDIQQESGREPMRRLETIYSVDEGRQDSASPSHQRVPSTKKRKILQAPTEHLIEEEPTKKELRFAGVESSSTASGEDGKESEMKQEEKMDSDEPSTGKEMQPQEQQPSSSGGELSPPGSSSDQQSNVNQFVQKVTEMDRKIQPLVEWAQSPDVQTPSPRQNMRQMVLMCQKRLNEVREMEPAVTKMQIQLEYLHNRTKLTPKQLHAVNEIFDIFMSRWSKVVGTISKVLSNLSKPEPLIKSPSKTPEKQTQQQQNRILVMVDQLSKWIKASDKYLDELPAEMPTKERLKKIAQIAKQLSEQQAQISHVKRLAKFSPDEEKAMSQLEHEMVLLVGRIDKMRREGEREDRGDSSPRTTTVQLKKDTSMEDMPDPMVFPSTSMAKIGSSTSEELSPPPMNEAESLRSKLLAEEHELAKREEELKIEGPVGEGWSKWFQEKQGQLKLGGECVPGDLKVLSAELERCDRMIADLRSKLREASSSESDAEMVAPIEQLLKAAETKRNHCVDSINKTQLAIHKAVKVEEVGDKFKRELDWLRKNLADSPLKEAEERLKHLKASLQAQESTKREAILLLEEVAQMAASNSSQSGNAAEQMRNRIGKLESQWKQLEDEIEDLLSCCSRECHRRAESWLQSKQSLLEELEHALKASFESATDAEELSEHLDNLERLIDRLGSIEREAEEEGYHQELTAFDPRIVALKDQNEALARATYERCNQLRNAVSRCEHFDQRLCQMQHWCTNMHQILNQRLASDTFALEVPHEYKEAQRTGSLFKKMDKEFAEYDQLVAELDEYISKSRSDFASTERLKLQLDHANQQLRQLRAKYAEFKQPIGLFERMDRIEKQLAETETSMDDLTGVQAENCEFCLLHVEQLQRQLEELSTECAACEAGRDTLIREGILEEAQAIKITARLATLTAKCVDELEPRAKSNVQRLRRATELLEKLERENAVLDKLLGEVEHRLESELDQTMMEGKPTQRSVKALDELTRQLRTATDTAAKAREMESLLRQLSIRLSQETLVSISKSEERSSKLKDRLSQWSEKIQELAESSQTGGESENEEERALAKVDELATELETRIGNLEQKVANEKIAREWLNQQLNEIRPLKERFEKRALQLLGKTAFSKRVAPTLADLTSRWQTLKQLLLEKQKQEQQERQERERTEKAAREQVAEDILAEVARDLLGQSEQLTQTGAMPSSLVEPLAVRVETEPIGEISGFGQRVQSMIDQFEKAKRHLNYAKHPLHSLEDWEKRLSELSRYVASRKLNFDELIAEGKQVAEVGPMELVTSAALAKLDELIELVHELDEQIEREETRLHKIRKQFGKFHEQVQLTTERLAAMGRRAASLNQLAVDPTPIITLQQELMDTSGQLQLLQLSADELRKSLPPAMHEEHIGGDVLDHLNRQLHDIEARVQSALLRALQSQQEVEADEGQTEEYFDQTLPEDEFLVVLESTPSMPSGMPHEQTEQSEQQQKKPAAMSGMLAMDAYGTDEEVARVEDIPQGKHLPRSNAQESDKAKPAQSEEELLESTVTARPHLPSATTMAQQQRAKGQKKTSIEQIISPQMEELVSMDQFYVNLNTMEEYMEQHEALPFEGLDEKADILKDFESELQRGEQLVAARQMTMEVGESEHIHGRITALRQQLAKRKAELEKRRETVRALAQLYTQCEQMLDELARHCKTPRHSPRGLKQSEDTGASTSGTRNGSPDLDELETVQAQLESQLPPIAMRLQQIQNRLNAIAEQLSSTGRNTFQQRIRLLVDDFNECTKIVRAKRKALEERFADQTKLNQHLEDLEFWCDETEAIVDSGEHVGPLNPPKLEQHLERVRQRHCSADAKLDAFRQLERLKDRFVGLASVEAPAKHEVRRNVAQLGRRVSDVRMKLMEKMDALTEEKLSSDELWREISAMQEWVENAERQVRAVENAKIFKPSLMNIEKLATQMSEIRLALQGIQRKLANEKLHCQLETPGGVEKENLMRVDDLLHAFEKVVTDIERLLEQRAAASEESSSLEEEIEHLYSQMDSAKEKLAKQSNEPEKLIENGHHQMAQHWPEQNGHNGVVEYGTLSTHSGEDNSGGRGQIQISPPSLDTDSVFNGDDAQNRYPRRKMSVGEQARLDTVTRLRSWLQEVERDVSQTVDLSDQHLVRQALGKMQNCVDDIQIHQLEIIRVLDEARDRLIVERAQLCSSEMERVLCVCKRRKGELQKILEQCRIWEQLRAAIELWLNEANDRLTSSGRVVELSDPELAEQLELCNQLTNELDIWKEKLQEMNRISNQLLDIYRRDDGHNLSHLSSKLNTQWAKFNEQLHIRRAVLEAAQRSRHDFQTALGHFQQWLNKQSAELQKLEKETDNPARVKDTGRRREWLAQEKEARMEIDAHREMMESVKRMGRKLLEEQQQEMSSLGDDAGTASSKARDQLRKRVEAVESEWQALLELDKIVRDRLESAQEECERLTQSLAEFLFWTDQQRKTITNSKPVGGDLSGVQKQCDIARTIQRGVEARERPVEECIRLAHEFLMQHNLRPPLHHPSLMADPPTDPYNPKTEAEREERRVGQQINSDSKQLQSQWAILKEELTAWYQQVSDAHKEMLDLDRSMAEALLSIGQVEEELHALKPVEDLLLEELKAAKAESSDFRQRVHEAGTHVDDVNNWASSIQATGIQLSEQLDNQVKAVNERYDRLKRDLGCRWVVLERAFDDFGPASERFLVDLVEPPWQRAISTTNRLPYYIDHSTERTQWDHPAMVDILEGLCSFNQVKFSAYRTAMKLRALQKRLCLDLIDLPDLNVQYEKHLANYTDDKRIQVEDVIQCLLPLFEKAQLERPALVPNVSLAVDLTLNLLLNIYDPCRDAKMRVLSFKIALVVLCHATLESKYTYLFHLISNKDGVDHKRLAVLFYDLIHIPKFLGEAAAFGGSNIEPSVRSCFEHAKFPPTINVDQFLEWLKKEPQSLVWLPVMHRLASSEFAKHQAKCNACKMFPIVGLRYRCLRCFNFDICQNCFFSQRIAKSHKLNHPMQEYCTPTSTGDDVRDFTAVIKNKVRQGKGKIGYLPVDQINEGPPLECTDQTPQNVGTEGMHQRMHLIASRLEKRQAEAAEHFPSAIILPSEGKMNGNAGSKGLVGVGTLPAPIMMGNGTESDNGSSNNGDELNEQTRRGLVLGRIQSPDIQIFHDRQRNSQQVLASIPQPEVKSPTQLISQVDQASKEELGQLLQKLQYENIELKRKIEERRKAIRAGITYQGATSTPNLYSRTPMMGYAGNRQASEAAIAQQQIANAQATSTSMDPHQSRARSISSVGQTPMPIIFAQQPAVLPPPVPRHYSLAGRSMPASLHRQHSLGSPIYTSGGTLMPGTAGSVFEGVNDHEQQMAVLAEAHQLRMHQKRLEERGLVLEDQNRQLQMQLERLQKLMEKKGETPHCVPRRDAIQSGVISSTEAEDTDMEMLGIRSSDIRSGGLSTGQIGTEIRRNRMDRLRETVDELNKAMENFVQFTQHCAANGAARREHPDTDQDSGTADQEEGQVTTDEHEQ